MTTQTQHITTTKPRRPQLAPRSTTESTTSTTRTTTAPITLEEIKKILLGPKVFVLDSGEVCTICLDDMEEGDEARTIECKHTFHTNCISEWVKQKATCPLCRFDMYSTLHTRKRKIT
ncbi:hypothetical protein AQUCO_00100154v1 [Aquilegia coerulea]|uniref:RING-type E3 ubiquitin transferase n=1 Tax=Aquilegia coerulea TaxID=218851 RepID=A0A2G5F935_AQUCA|nr:hypothetical protein AQUCO_00100154v1 [Aquilegia coerulea]